MRPSKSCRRAKSGPSESDSLYNRSETYPAPSHTLAQLLYLHYFLNQRENVARRGAQVMALRCCMESERLLESLAGFQLRE